ncbi:MAG: FtsQ-type POTRA domain-containing protein [Chromatiaceae bacterium]|nr:FtsQ-type POTRA domain-containing protein [Chromatiaceae bacterium]MCP5408149.1 FtsQ-type POTRA domain-containing protein [Chromatiaceae bacterium]MCP5443048.1 FtsQ-type POTRA domain-containing protein [Chromatiaceae bacterium]
MTSAGNMANKAGITPFLRRLDWSKAGRWGLALLLFGAIGSGAVWVAKRLQDPRVLPFKVVQIDGQFRYLDRLQIEKTVGSEIRGNFFTVDVERVHRAARNLPWIHQVSVRRVWPQTLVIRIVEQVPMARWGKNQLVNMQGDIFSPSPDEIPENLPYLDGPVGSSHEMAAQYLDLKPKMALLGLELDRFSVDARRSWKLSFAGGMHLYLGSKEIDARLRRFISIFPRIQSGTEIEGKLLDVDLRYSNGFTVRREQNQKTPDSDNRGPATDMQSGRV